MYLAAVSMRQVEDLPEALWDNQVSPGAVLKLNKKINDWQQRMTKITGAYKLSNGLR